MKRADSINSVSNEIGQLADMQIPPMDSQRFPDRFPMDPGQAGTSRDRQEQAPDRSGLMRTGGSKLSGRKKSNYRTKTVSESAKANIQVGYKFKINTDQDPSLQSWEEENAEYASWNLILDKQDSPSC
jgi:hypothetical protein